MRKEEITAKLIENKNTILEIVKQSTEEVFNISKNGKWSQAGHIEHLIKSTSPLNQLFSLPKIFMKFKWGKATRESRNYEALVKKYNDKLAAKPFTGENPFGPDKNKQLPKEELLLKLSKNYEKLAKKINKNWNEESLEQYVIPHPLLGKLTVREMMMFTVYHTEHHTKAL
jgi:hypothetical protein